MKAKIYDHSISLLYFQFHYSHQQFIYIILIILYFLYYNDLFFLSNVLFFPYFDSFLSYFV